MASSDDDAMLIAEWQELQDHLNSMGPAERLRYERMDETEKAMYEYEIRQRRNQLRGGHGDRR